MLRILKCTYGCVNECMLTESDMDDVDDLPTKCLYTGKKVVWKLDYQEPDSLEDEI